MKQKYLARITIFLCMLLLIFSAASTAYAETYFECRDGGVSIYRESGWDNWQIAEIDEAESSGKPFEHIASGKEINGTDPLMFDIYFSADTVTDGEYVYFYEDENAALDYYDKYGKNALVQLYAEQIASGDTAAQITYGTPVYTENQWNSFLKAGIVMTADLDGDGNRENRTDMVYLTATTTSKDNFVINEALVFHNGSGTQLTQKQLDTAAEIADEFYEYGYGDEMTGDYYDDEEYDEEYYTDGSSEEIIAAVLFVVVVVLIIAAVIAAAIIRRRRMSSGTPGRQFEATGDFRVPGQQFGTTDSSGAPGRQFSTQADSEASGSQAVWGAKRRNRGVPGRHNAHKDRKERSTGVAGVFEETKTPQNGNAGVVMQQPASSDEQRYIDSLNTLCKSGLLTRAEMNEMIERHRAQNMRREERL